MECPNCNRQIRRCPECGGTIKYNRTQYLEKTGTTKYYTCLRCGRRIRIGDTSDKTKKRNNNDFTDNKR